MKSTGIVRKVDELGRIVLPKETRSLLGIENRDGLEIFVEESMIILRKYQPGCVFCDNAMGLVEFRGIRICQSCLEELKDQGR